MLRLPPFLSCGRCDAQKCVCHCLHVVTAVLRSVAYASNTCVAVVYSTLQVLLILQYSYLTAARCLCIQSSSSGTSTDGSGSSTGCVWVLPTDPTTTRHVFDILGLHTTSAGVLPLFLIYLAVLVYNYQLGSSSSYQSNTFPGQQTATAVQPGSSLAPQQGGSGSGSRQEVASADAEGAGGIMGRQEGSGAAGAVMLVVALQGWVSKLWMLRRFVVHKLSYWLR